MAMSSCTTSPLPSPLKKTHTRTHAQQTDPQRTGFECRSTSPANHAHEGWMVQLAKDQPVTGGGAAVDDESGLVAGTANLRLDDGIVSVEEEDGIAGLDGSGERLYTVRYIYP